MSECRGHQVAHSLPDGTAPQADAALARLFGEQLLRALGAAAVCAPPADAARGAGAVVVPFRRPDGRGGV